MKSLKNANDMILKMAFCLALAPEEKFSEGLEVLKEKINCYEEQYHEELKKFVSYLERYWGRKTHILCVGHLPHRTNNICESLNSKLTRRMGKHPGVWKFLCM